MPITYEPSTNPNEAPLPDELQLRPRQWSGRGKLLLGAVSALVLAGIIGLLSARPAPSQSVRFPDGSVVSLEAVTFGMEQKTTGTLLQRLLRAVAPNQLKGLTGAREYEGSAPGELTFWARHFLSPAQLAAPSPAQIVTVPQDEAGNFGPSVNGQGLGDYNERYVCSSFPRRGRTIRLQFFERVDAPGGSGDPTWKPLGEFTVPNPAPSSYPAWSAPALPVKAAADSVELELSEFTQGMRPKDTWLNPGPGENYFLAKYQLRERGKPTEAWTAELRSFQDATGNNWSVHSSGTTSQGGGAYEAYFTGPISPGEAVLQAQAYLWPTAKGPIPSRDRWTIRDIPIPAKGRTLALLRRQEVLGVPLELTAIYGVGAKLPVGFVTPDHRPRVILRSPASMPEELRSLLVSAVDDRGRPVDLNFDASSSDGTRKLEVFRVEAPPGARSISLVYALIRRRGLSLRVPVKHVGK